MRLLVVFLILGGFPVLAQEGISRGDLAAVTTEEISLVETSSFAQELGNLFDGFAAGDPDVVQVAEQVKNAYKVAKPARGDTNATYDIVIQSGHFGRTKGNTGGEGEYVNEREYAAYVASELANALQKLGVDVLLISADGYGRPLKSKIFLSFHTDSSAFPCSVGPSVGYDSIDDSLGMHFIAYALATSLEYNPKNFMRDSYTKNLKNYYAFRHMETSSFEGVLEMSELSCPDQELNLLRNADKLVAALSLAIQFALREAS